MKPSERIEQLQEDERHRIMRDRRPDGGLDRSDLLEAWLIATLRYLDEQHEIEQSRIAEAESARPL